MYICIDHATGDEYAFFAALDPSSLWNGMGAMAVV